MRAGRLTAGLLSALLLGVSSGCSEPNGPEGFEPPRRVIWLVLDSLRTQSMTGHGYERATTPWLDDVAENAVNFEWAIAPSNVTPYSVLSFFSGLHASVLGSPRHPVWVPPGVVTIAEHLQDADFKTYMWTANINLQGNGFEDGFDYHNYVTRKSTILARLDDIIWSVERDYKRSRSREFIYIHTMDIHYPYQPPLELEKAFLPEVAGTGAALGGEMHDELGNLVISTQPYFSELHTATDEDIDVLHGLYDGAIRYTDRELTRLLDALEYSPERDLLIITSDHGEQFQEHGYWGHNRSMLPEELRVPLIFVYPGFEQRNIETAVSLMDIYPTLCEMYGLAEPDDLAGVSLFAALRGGHVPEHAVYAESLEDLTLGATLVTDEHWYWFVGHNKREGWRTWPYNQMLFRYREDPTGKNDISGEEPETVAALQKELAAVNPRWAPFRPELVQPPEGGPRLGQNVLDQKFLEQSGLWGKVAPGVDPESPSLAGVVDVALKEGHLAVLEVGYSLTEGIYLFEMVNPISGERRRLWYVGKPRPGGHEHVQALYDMPAEFQLALRVIRPGDLRIDALAIRQLDSPLIQPDYVGRFAHGAEGADATRSDEEIERLKALGYL